MSLGRYGNLWPSFLHGSISLQRRIASASLSLLGRVLTTPHHVLVPRQGVLCLFCLGQACFTPLLYLPTQPAFVCDLPLRTITIAFCKCFKGWERKRLTLCCREKSRCGVEGIRGWEVEWWCSSQGTQTLAQCLNEFQTLDSSALNCHRKCWIQSDDRPCIREN